MDGSNKGWGGLGDLMRGRSLPSRSSSTNRQQPMGSSPTALNDNGACSGGDGVNTNGLMVRWKKEKVRASRWRSKNKVLSEAGSSRSEGEDGSNYQPMHCTTATSLTSRKKARLHGKVAEDSDTVDPAPAPRKLRSAINKRSSQPLSFETPNSKKRYHNTCRGQLVYGNDAKKCKENSLVGSFTKDEEEVVEALCALSRVLPTERQILDKEYVKVSEACQDDNVTIVACSDVMKEDKNLMQQQTVTREIASLASSTEKTLEEPMENKSAPSKQAAVLRGSQTVNSDLNRNEPGRHETLSESEQRERTHFRDPVVFSSAPGVLPCHCNKNSSVMQLTKSDATIPTLPACTSDVQKQNGCVGSSALRHEVQEEVINFSSNAKLGHTEGAFPPHIQSLSNSSVWSGLVRLPSSKTDCVTKKVPRNFASKWKRCAIHVFIGRLIKSYQSSEKHGTLPLANEESKSRDRGKSCAPANSERDGLQSGLNGVPSIPRNDGYVVERNKHEVRNEITSNGRFVPAQQSSVSLEAKQKQACDFLSLSAISDASGSVTGVKSSGQLPSPNLHAQVPHHPLMPFSFPHLPYVPPYTEKLVPVPTQQVQLQVPHFIGNRFYEAQMDNTMSNIQLQQQYHQQQIWHAHYAHHYRSPISIGVSQGERMHDPSASPCQITQTLPTAVPPPSIQIQGGSYHPPIHRQHRQFIVPTTVPPPSIQIQGGSYHPPILRQHRQFIASHSKAKPHQNQQPGTLH